MKAQTKTKSISPQLIKADPNSPAIEVTGRDGLAIKPGTIFDGFTFTKNTPVAMPADGLAPGADYAITVVDGGAVAFRLDAVPTASSHLGGFHFAPGGNAPARAGGDTVPSINPFSLWDLNFRPTCPDPRGMALVEKSGGRFWCDIYLTGVNHLRDGTSKFGITIADGNDRPLDGAGKKAKKFDYETACAVMAAHGKGLLSLEEFFAAAFGVTEKSASDSDPKITGIDATRTSKFGLMQATGNLWIWGHDGDPDTPRLLGGSWFRDDYAGSRFAYVDYWVVVSFGRLGARGRSDHLQPV
jgi:hypothetical protein